MNKNAYREWLLKLIVIANPKGGGLINISGPCTSNHSNDSDQEMRNICTSRNHLRCSYSKKVGVRTLRKYVEEEKTALPMEMLRHQRLGIEKMLGKYGVELLPTVNHANTSISVMQ